VTPLLPPGTLAARVATTTAHALSTGALSPIATRETTLADPSGIRFLVRIAASLRRKDAAREPQASPANPFLPPDPALTVAEVSDTHVAVLNKFSVVERHLLLVTRAFEEQEMLLSPADFAALWACLGECDALGFYNGGREAGASQPHKHLQLVPLPLGPGPGPLPIAPLLPAAAPDLRVPALPFRHAFARLDAVAPARAAEQAFALYSALLGHAGMAPADPRRPRRQSMPYDLLTTRDWMLLVPRTRESFADISLNALAFAGSLFVRNEEQLALLQQVGPMHALQAVTLPPRD
jgi:ATP adenylyltransferase